MADAAIRRAAVGQKSSEAQAYNAKHRTRRRRWQSWQKQRRGYNHADYILTRPERGRAVLCKLYGGRRPKALRQSEKSWTTTRKSRLATSAMALITSLNLREI
jgi:adenosyl cobinamide kinase/adenosyl cobinamide phosphate guanylyltransferase